LSGHRRRRAPILPLPVRAVRERPLRISPMIRLAFQAVSGWSNNSFTKGRIWVHLSTETSLSLISVGGLFHYRRFPLFCPIFCPNISPKSLVYSEHLCYYDSMNFPSTFPPHPAPSASNHLIRFSFVLEDRIPSSPSPIGIEFYLPALVLSGTLKFNSPLRSAIACVSPACASTTGTGSRSGLPLQGEATKQSPRGRKIASLRVWQLAIKDIPPIPCNSQIQNQGL
jgi:hypothetical protein